MKLIGLTISLLLLLTSCKETIKEAFDLNSLPNDWVRLTDKDGKFVVYNSCDAGNLLLTISKKSDHFELLLHGQQEDYDFEILESTQLNDTIFLKAKWKDSDEKQDFKFFWTDKDKGLGRFITTYSSGFTSNNLFVTRDKQTNFEKFDQPCQECWGDECDEFEKDIEINNISDTLTKSVPIPDYTDFESETEIYYSNYIGKAYDKTTFESYYNISRQKLDSLIKDYDKKNAL